MSIGHVVRSGIQRVFLPRLDQLDHRFSAAVHADLTARRSDVQRNLLPFVLRRSQNVRRLCIQGFIARIALVRAVFSIFQWLLNFVAARFCFDFPLALHNTKESIVIAHVVQ